MFICPECGEKVDEFDIECPNCGSPFVDEYDDYREDDPKKYETLKELRESYEAGEISEKEYYKLKKKV